MRAADETILRDEILNILLAGRDTVRLPLILICRDSHMLTPSRMIVAHQTTNSITFAVYMLAEHPEVCKRLRQEILEHVGDSQRPTFDDMKDMKYLRAVINETIRLYPAVYVTIMLRGC